MKKHNERNAGRKPLPFDEVKKNFTVTIKQGDADLLRKQFGTLTKAILSTQNMKPIKITYSDGSTKEFMANTDAFDMPNPVVGITKIEMFYQSTKAILTTINK